jgi:hypothetical protein
MNRRAASVTTLALGIAGWSEFVLYDSTGITIKPPKE